MEKLNGKKINTAVFISGRGSNLRSLIKYFNKKNMQKVKKYFSKKFQPYVIGKVSKSSERVKFNGKIKW